VEINEVDKAALAGLPVDARSRIGFRAVVYGVVVMLAIELVMMVFGAAVGLTAVRPTSGAEKGVGIGLYVWLIISASVATFFGAWFASSTARAISRGEGLLHGIMIWGVMSLIATWVIGGAVSQILGSALGNAQDQKSLAQLGLWGLFILLILPLFSALIGGALGARPIERQVAFERHDLERRIERPIPPTGAPTVPTPPLPTPT
jgi:hypothetical protein